MKIKMLKTRNVGTVGELQAEKSYSVEEFLGDQLIGQGVAVAAGKVAEAVEEKTTTKDKSK
jgi:hypothetical protein